jgi:hypothetical protein
MSSRVFTPAVLKIVFLSRRLDVYMINIFLISGRMIFPAICRFLTIRPVSGII